MTMLLTGTGGGAAAFAPTDIAGLQWWVKADSLSLNDGDLVATWADQSGNGRDATQTTDANKPIYKVNIQNGKPVVREDGTDGMMNVTMPALTALSFFVVIIKRGTGVGDRTILSAGNEYELLANKLTHYNGGVLSDSNALVDGTCVLAAFIGNASSRAIYKNGVSVASDATAMAISSGARVILNIGALGRALNADIPEMILYNSVLSAANRQAVESYLNTKYVIY